MMTRKIIDAFSLVHPDGVERWTIATLREDGVRHDYYLPVETFQNLAVEYGLDETDIDELLRIALHQFHAPCPWNHPDVETDPAARKGHIRNGLPVRLDNADSTDQARAAHLERISCAEQHVRFIFPEPGREKRQLPTLLRAGGRISVEDAEVDPHERLQTLKRSYRPDRAAMEMTRGRLRRALRRDV